MADLNEIEEYLDIDMTNKRLRHGKKHHEKNPYYWFRHRFYIIQVHGDKWFVMSSNNRTRELLRDHTWSSNDRAYIRTSVNKKHKKLHRVLMREPNELVVDHINRRVYDNRLENLRIVTHRQNSRNTSINKNNTSGITGVRVEHNAYTVRITNNDGVRLSKSFSIKKYGQERAKELAVAQRNLWKQEFDYQGE